MSGCSVQGKGWQGGKCDDHPAPVRRGQDPTGVMWCGGHILHTLLGTRGHRGITVILLHHNSLVVREVTNLIIRHTFAFEEISAIQV